MELSEQFQNRINQEVNDLGEEYRSYSIYKVSGDLVIDKIDNIENAIKLNPDFIIVEFKYVWKNFQFGNHSERLVFLTNYSSLNGFFYTTWKILVGKSIKDYTTRGYYFNISDHLGFEREVRTKSASVNGYKELFEYVKLVTKWNTWKEYDLFIENYHLRFENLENRIENCWNKLLLTQDLNLLAEFENFEKEIQDDRMYDKGEFNIPAYFFAKELNELSKRADLIYRISLIKKANCLLAAESKAEANNCFANATRKRWGPSGYNEKIVENLESMIQKDRELLVKYFQIAL